MLRTAVVALLLTGCATAPPAAGFKQLTFSLLEDYDKGTDLREIERDFETMRDLGIDTWRGSFGWDDYEPAPGQYDFDWLRQFVATAQRQSIALRPYIGYTPEWAARGGADEHAWNDPPRSLDSWRSFIAALAGALAEYPNVLSYEIYNEQNTQLWWEGDVADYIPLLTAADAVIDRHHPSAEVIMGGLVWPDAEWLETVCSTAAGAFDIAAIHAYPETWSEPGVTVENYLTGEYDTFREVARTTCGGKPLWVNETGFATTPGRSEREQANWWARAIATFAATPGVEHIGIYEIKDLPTDQPVIGEAANYHLGLLRRDRSPKLAYHTVRTIVRLLAERPIAAGSAGVRVRGDAHHESFLRSDGTIIVFVWSDTPANVVSIDPEFRPSAVREHYLDGTTASAGSLDSVRLADDVRIFEIRRR